MGQQVMLPSPIKVADLVNSYDSGIEKTNMKNVFLKKEDIKKEIQTDRQTDHLGPYVNILDHLAPFRTHLDILYQLELFRIIWEVFFFQVNFFIIHF